ncbi:hypothetical protein BDA99DRAFT_562149 [Phascolomyces articulosus]|uniref:Uncharacterized protein n=1 Tax=Phascolomyces articulosus TaxID=60185 RepID=A0AAD5PB55_9FUNG|nr:hypothetical protein BDA99DRAFT_562149 [Phascolomyces articulosus]
MNGRGPGFPVYDLLCATKGTVISCLEQRGKRHHISRQSIHAFFMNLKRITFGLYFTTAPCLSKEHVNKDRSFEEDEENEGQVLQIEHLSAKNSFYKTNSSAHSMIIPLLRFDSENLPELDLNISKFYIASTRDQINQISITNNVSKNSL